MAEIIMSVGSKSTTITIATVDPGPFPFTLNLSGDPDLSNMGLGDFVDDTTSIWDVVSVDNVAKTVTVSNNFSTLDPAPASATVGRAYSGTGAWELRIDEFHDTNDDGIVELHNDALISEAVVTLDGVPSGGGGWGTGKVVIRAAAGQEHHGTAATGARITFTGNGRGLQFNFSASVAPAQQLVQDIEFVGRTASGFTTGVSFTTVHASATRNAIERCLFHGFDTSAGISVFMIEIGILAKGVDVLNCVLHDGQKAGGGVTKGIRILGDDCRVFNCTVYDVVTAGISSNAATGKEPEVRNCAVFASGTEFEDTSGNGWHADSGYNATNESSAPGSNNQVSLTAANEFVDLTGGAEIFALKKSSALVDAGENLSASMTAEDIVGRGRPSPKLNPTAAATWDIGAFEYPHLPPARPVDTPLLGSGL